MEDRYLFKAKRLDWREFPEKEQWIIGYYVLGFNEYEQPVHLIFEPTSMFFSHGETDGWTEIDSSTLCQCTGLKDKNGKRIWENDIVSFAHENYTRNYAIEFKNTFHNYGLRFRNKSIHFRCTQVTLCMHDCEVIGNIFDNPELLESEGQYDRK
nr:MAG TPA: YopX protein [Caudoviricetes sp.]